MKDTSMTDDAAGSGSSVTVTHVRAVHDDYARVGAAAVPRAGHIQRRCAIDTTRAALQQSVREATSAGAKVARPCRSHRSRTRQRVVELLAATAHEPGRRLDANLVRWDHRSRLDDGQAIYQDVCARISACAASALSANPRWTSASSSRSRSDLGGFVYHGSASHLDARAERRDLRVTDGNGQRVGRIIRPWQRSPDRA